MHMIAIESSIMHVCRYVTILIAMSVYLVAITDPGLIVKTASPCEIHNCWLYYTDDGLGFITCFLILNEHECAWTLIIKQLCGIWSALAGVFIPTLQPLWPTDLLCCLYYHCSYRFSNCLWRSVLTSLIVRAASVTTTHCVAGVLWRTSVLKGHSARMQWSQWDGCKTPVSVSQPQSPPASLFWITQRLWVVLILCFHSGVFHYEYYLAWYIPKLSVGREKKSLAWIHSLCMR